LFAKHEKVVRLGVVCVGTPLAPPSSSSSLPGSLTAVTPVDGVGESTNQRGDNVDHDAAVAVAKQTASSLMKTAAPWTRWVGSVTITKF
jgi:hypothetical protein